MIKPYKKDGVSSIFLGKEIEHQKENENEKKPEVSGLLARISRQRDPPLIQWWASVGIPQNNYIQSSEELVRIQIFPSHPSPMTLNL